MTQKVKAAPGRPKAQPKVAQETTLKEPVLEFQVKPESVKDTFQDLSIYGIIAQIVKNKQWK